MVDKRTPFKVHDMRRALRAVKDEGFIVDRVEVDPTGKFVIVSGTVSQQDHEDPLDKWMRTHAAAP
jgi:hypothetical protein